MKNLPRVLWLALLIACLCLFALPTAALAANPTLDLIDCHSDVIFIADGATRNYKYTDKNGAVTSIIYAAGEAVEISYSGTDPWKFSIIIEIGDHDVILNNVNIKCAGLNSSPVLVKVRASLNMTLAENTTANLAVTGGYQAGICVEEKAALTISGTGSLNVTGNGGAGIGGGNGLGNSNSGDITINGGIIKATGGGQGAGIGGGNKGSGTVTINGGDIKATGGALGAGIGGGNKSSGTVTIEGGAIEATGGEKAAGIGGGIQGGGTVTIEGGTIEATGGNGGAGIGGGNQASGTVTITDGIINATGSNGGTGIGGGAQGSGTVTIKSGTISATGGNGGAGIGGGLKGNGEVTIEGGNITATGGSGVTVAVVKYGGAGIGSGSLADGTVSITGGTITATGGWGGSGIGGGYGGGLTDTIGIGGNGEVTISSGTIIAYGGAGAAGIGGGYAGATENKETTHGVGRITITGGIVTATGGEAAEGVNCAVGIGSGNNAYGTGDDAGYVNIPKANIYHGTSADPKNKLSAYSGQSPVHITYGKNVFGNKTLPNFLGGLGTVGGSTTGGNIRILPLGNSYAQSIAGQVGGIAIIGADIHVVGGTLNGVGFAISTGSIKEKSNVALGKEFFIAHEISVGGTIEMLPVNQTKQCDTLMFTSLTAPSGNSPFVLVMRDAPTPTPTPPQTGDDAQPWLWAGLGVLAVAGIVVWAVLAKRRKHGK